MYLEWRRFKGKDRDGNNARCFPNAYEQRERDSTVQERKEEEGMEELLIKRVSSLCYAAR